MSTHSLQRIDIENKRFEAMVDEACITELHSLNYIGRFSMTHLEIIRSTTYIYVAKSERIVKMVFSDVHFKAKTKTFALRK